MIELPVRDPCDICEGMASRANASTIIDESANTMKWSIVIASLILFSAGYTHAATPSPTKSEYMLSTGAGFIIEDGALMYAMNFEITKDLPEGFHLKFLFENPRKKQPPITNTGRFEIEQNRVLVQSPPLECIRNRRNYLVTVEIYLDTSESELISTHEQKVEFRVPKDLFKATGLTQC